MNGYYITKPWDAGELKAVVQQAAVTYDLLKQQTEELRRVNAQTALLTLLLQVVQSHPSLEASLTRMATIFGERFAADSCILQLVEGNALVAVQGTYGNDGQLEWLAQDLTTEVIATQKMQLKANIPNETNLAGIRHYQTTGIKAHLIIPIIYRDEVLAVLSLQWKQPCTLREDELRLIHLSTQVVALTLSCNRCYRPPV